MAGDDIAVGGSVIVIIVIVIMLLLHTENDICRL
jgi:hypothetical protein